ncbi:hypothetical protein BCR32DRAFT_330187 [Anaeromyces robustus]|uniref:(4-O-methyl)-D-glucuronate--lignin esterase n=1 Tax=Anaeromyces robustus TaxID=1754192 RepID=A0A1Y1W5T1_9FUNG|nr:hypothetical protein BCR32DRAFT_330187 [Anaeromyces robustus]|eukprot:ORX68900.1 hypothetical protein BCR32DRAFT_330187 [Anaeromyces robustus]
MKFSVTSIGLIIATLYKTVVADVPLVYSKENTGSSCNPPQLPNPGQCPTVQKLPDPFEWSNGSGRVKTLADWECRRNEIKAEIENYELGKKPAPPQNVKATYSGGTLTVVINDNNGSATLTSKLNVPSGNGPFPIIIGMNSGTGSLSASQFSGFIQVPFNHDQCAKYSMNGQKDTNAQFYKMYPNLKQAGDYIAWSWGVSRLIDGLEQVKDQIHADISHIGVTGCSYAGKMALFAGALDERVALTIAQESGGGGINSWRVSDTIGNVEKIDNTNYSWFMQALKNNFGNGKATKLPYDHHELVAMIAPRAFFTLGNPDYEWLGDKSGYTSAMAAYEVWKAMGVEDRFGFNFVGGHTHCSAAGSQVNDVNKFIDRFLRGKNTNTSNMLSSTVNSDYNSWISQWKGYKIDTSSAGSTPENTTPSQTTINNTQPVPTSGTGNGNGNGNGNGSGTGNGNGTGNNTSNGSCWSLKLGYKCCKKNNMVVLTDTDGQWGVENNEWCGIVHSSSCWSKKLGYNCCTAKCPKEYYIDNDGSWGVENNNWCGILKFC